MAASIGVLPAHAHKLSIFAVSTETGIQGKVYFPAGGAAGLNVRATNATGEQSGEAVSDAEGNFAIPGRFALPVTIVSETNDGHRAAFVIEAPAHTDAPAADASPRPESTRTASPAEERIRAIVRQELVPLREQLAAQADRVRVRDIIGGIGYIAGIFGVFALAKSRLRKTP